MAILNQISSLFKLPGQLYRTSQSQKQAQSVASQLAQVQANQVKPMVPAVNVPSMAPIQAPIQQPTNNIQSAQLDAIKTALSGISQGLKQISNTASSIKETPVNQVASVQEDRMVPIENEMVANITPTTEETDLERQIANIQSAKDKGLIQAELEGTPLQAILGEQGRIERRATAETGTLQQRLASLQAKRQAALDVAKTKLDIEDRRAERAKPNETKIDEFTNENGERVIVFQDQKTGKTRNEVVGKEQIKQTQTQTDRDRALKTESIKVARPLLINSRGRDGYVDPNTYMKLRSDYAEAIGNPDDFDAIFEPMLSPAERSRLFSLKSVAQATNRASSTKTNEDEGA